MPRAGWLFALVLVAALPRASAEPRRLTVDTPVEAFRNPGAGAPAYLYLNRCVGGCTIVGTGGSGGAQMNDASMNMTTIASTGTYTVGEYQNGAGASGAAADEEWGQVVQCMKEVYSPYNVMVTDTVPPAPYDMAVIAGRPQEVGLGNDILGIAPLAADCSAQSNVLSFTFANYHGNVQRVNNVCWTAAQESAHAYGLDHEFSFTSGNPANNHSACNDPMTYRNDCGGQKFFRNDLARCGETGSRACKCGGTQNSHLKLLSVFGPSAAPPIVAPPTATLGSPAQTDALLGPSVVVTAGGTRGIARVELDFNGFAWVDAPGALFGLRGQANPSTYTIAVPSSLPSSIVDVRAIAYDDLGTPAATAIVTVTRNAPCTADTACAPHQTCESGRCLWPAPVGELGAACVYPQFCKSGLCMGAADSQICTQQCIPGYVACPQGFDCATDGADTGVCRFSTAGCCSVDRGGGGAWLPVGLGLAVLGLVARPRRRR
jgi:hypothetical protein